MSDQPLLQLGLPSPHLPNRTASGRRSVLGSILVHASAAAVLTLLTMGGRTTPPTANTFPTSAAPQVPRIVFLQMPGPGGGGGGGGHRQLQPPSHAQGVGHDRVTLPVARPVIISPDPADSPPITPSVVLQAVPLASGTAFLMGMPEAAPSLPFSQGSGSGGGVGEGTGTGIGSGKGPGFGPGSGGGFGGSIYRPGNGVVGPKLLKQVAPLYTPGAMERKVQGTVVLEAIIGLDGIPTEIRVVRSLDPYGLDVEAIRAARQWRFTPGHLGDTPVAVLVNIVLDFHMY